MNGRVNMQMNFTIQTKLVRVCTLQTFWGFLIFETALDSLSEDKCSSTNNKKKKDALLFEDRGSLFLIQP